MEVIVHLFQLLQTTLAIVPVLTIKELTVVTVSIISTSVCVCFGQYNILSHLINPVNHCIVLGVLNFNKL